MEEASEEPMCGVIERVRLVNFMNHECGAPCLSWGSPLTALATSKRASALT